MHTSSYVSAIAITLCGAFALSSESTAQAQGRDGSEYLVRPVPERWIYTPENVQTDPTDDPWWTSFDDPVLSSLVVRALDDNFNIRQAWHTSEVARAAIGQARAAYWPTLGANVGYTRSRTSGRDANLWQLGAQLQWEVDVFGKVRDNVRAGKESWRASRAQLTAMRVSIAAQVATSYVNLRLLQTHLAIAREHIARQKRVVEIATARHEAGLVSKLDVAQARTVLATTEASVPPMECELRQTLNSLAILLGVYPDSLSSLVSTPGPIPTHLTILPAGVPADLLRRRPDIIEAEANLAAKAALVGVAKKDFLPTLSLQGEIGFESPHTRDLFGKNGVMWSIGPSIQSTLFDGFGRKAALESARQEVEAAIAVYNLTVMTAVEEVDNAMAGYTSAIDSYGFIAEAYSQSDQAFELAMEQYKQGLTSFTDVANAQIDRLTYATSMATLKANAVIALIDLYKALGGSTTE